MAKLNGFLIDKVLGEVCVYQMNGQVYIRSKSSLTRKRVLKGKEFKSTRKHASHMATASRIGSAVYKKIQESKRKRFLYQAITGEAASMLYSGMSEKEVIVRLDKKFGFWKH